MAALQNQVRTKNSRGALRAAGYLATLGQKSYNGSRPDGNATTDGVTALPIPTARKSAFLATTVGDGYRQVYVPKRRRRIRRSSTSSQVRALTAG